MKTAANTKRGPNAEQLAALQAFATANGRKWKAELRSLWMDGAYSSAVLGAADPALLQQVRNAFGPTWLSRFSLAAAVPEWTEFIRVDQVIECYDVKPETAAALLEAMPDAYGGDGPGEDDAPSPDAPWDAPYKLSRIWLQLAPAVQADIEAASNL